MTRTLKVAWPALLLVAALASADDGAAAGKGPRGELKGLLSQALGVTPEELRQARAAGQSPADVAKQKGIPLETVQASLLAGLRERTDKAVAEGRLTQEQADRMLAAAPQRFEKLLLASGPRGASGRRHGARQGFSVVAEDLGLSPKQLQDALKGGATVATLAEQKASASTRSGRTCARTSSRGSTSRSPRDG